jgi:hypothetical protein
VFVLAGIVGVAQDGPAGPRSRGHDERPVRAGERCRHGLDRRTIGFSGLRKAREVVNEAEVDDAVGRRGTAPETVQIGQVAPLHLGASSRDCRRRCV